jgi:hypothetical protein
MKNVVATFKKLMALVVLGTMVTACAPQSGAFSDIDYGYGAGTTATTPSNISRMGYGF